MAAPPLVIPAGFAQIKIVIATSPDQTAEMVFGMDSEGFTAQQIADIMGPILDSSTNISAFLPTTSTVTKVAVRSNTGGVETTGEHLLSIVGVGTGATQAPQVAVLLRKNTGLSGKAYRGRTYFPQPAEVRVDNYGLLDSTALDAYQNLCEGIMAWFTDGEFAQYLLHTRPKTSDGPPPVYGTAPAPTLVTSMTVQPKVATQRRRVR